MNSEIKKVWRIVPDDGLPIALHPAGMPPDRCPIKKEYIVLAYSYNQFSKGQCFQGVFDGFIGSDLRMHVLINARDEVLNNWEPSEGRP